MDFGIFTMFSSFSGPNDVILQIGGYVADTAERARSEPEASTMRGRRRSIARPIPRPSSASSASPRSATTTC
jgi:hypothetical protein